MVGEMLSGILESGRSKGKIRNGYVHEQKGRAKQKVEHELDCHRGQIRVDFIRCMGVHVRCPVSPHGTLFGSLCEGGRPTGPRPEVHYSRSIFRQRIMQKIYKNSKRMYAPRESATEATMAAAQKIKRHDNGVDPL